MAARVRSLLSAVVVGGLLVSGLSVVAPALSAPAAAAAVGDAPEASVPGPGVRDYVPGPDPDMAINVADDPNPSAPVAPASGSSTEQVLSPAAADVAAKAPPSKDAFVLEQVVDPVPAPQPTAEPTPSAEPTDSPAAAEGAA